MSEFLKSFQDMFISRVKNMLVMNFIIAWCVVNYEVTLTVLFKTMPIDDKIKYIQDLSIGIMPLLLYPLILTIIYIYILPLVNLEVVRIYNRLVDAKIKSHQNDVLENIYDKKILLDSNKDIESLIYLKYNDELLGLLTVLYTKERINEQFEEFKKDLDQTFKEVNIFKPKASRPESKETYAIGTKIRYTPNI